jgi:amidophosphoribosyltransferase
MRFDDEGVQRVPWAIPMPETPSHCVFEHVYFARPDSSIFDDNVHKVRMELGRALAREAAVDADLVVGIPDSGTDAAMGYAAQSGLPLEVGFVRNHYVGRTFIRPNQALRSKGVELKLNPVRAVLEGKRVVVVDDSIVRGTTSQSRVRLLRRVGAKEIHLRISCPPIRHACYFGIDFPDSKELVATNRTLIEIAEFLGVDSIQFLSEEAMLNAMSKPASHYCTACFSGRYPVLPRRAMDKTRFESGTHRIAAASGTPSGALSAPPPAAVARDVPADPTS